MNMWDQRYSADEYVFGKSPNGFLAENVEKIPRGRVLCLAEGECRNAVFLAQQGHQVTAVDSSAVGLEKGRRLAQERGVQIETICADLTDFRLDSGEWEGIVAFFAHLPPPVRARIHREAVQQLAPGGAFVLEAYTPEQLQLGTGGPPNAAIMMELPALQSELQGLDFVIAQETRREIHEGKFHNGMSAVVQILALKPRGRKQ